MLSAAFFQGIFAEGLEYISCGFDFFDVHKLYLRLSILSHH